MSPRALISTFGSAGDLFPLVPVIRRLIDDGWEVRCAASRSLGLYLRAMGISPVAIGDGSEVRVVDDPAMFTTRFGGWSSWRRTLDGYLAPTLAKDVAVLGTLMDTWRPDVVVASGFAAAARLAAEESGIAVANLSIYPQHAALVGARGFARRFATALAEAGGGLGPAPSLARALGAPPDALLHDPEVVDAAVVGELAPVLGFPYWDAVPQRGEEVTEVERWLAGSEPPVVVTLGSFVGLAQRDSWLAAADAVETLGVRALLVGARGRWADEVFAERDDLLSVGFVPLADVMERVPAAVHHGGIGTMFGALRAGCPAVVVPQAFDQAHNARLVERTGSGLDATDRPLADALSSVLTDDRFARRAGEIADALIPIDRTLDAVVDVVERRRDRSAP